MYTTQNSYTNMDMKHTHTQTCTTTQSSFSFINSEKIEENNL